MSLIGWGGSTKISKIIFTAVLIALCSALFSQTAQNLQTTQNAQAAQNAPVAGENRVDETTLIIGAAENQAVVQPAQQNTLWLFVRMVLVLALVIASIYGLVALLKRGINPPQKIDPYLKSTASVQLGPGRSVHVITVGAQAFLIGVSENAVNLIGELDDKELIDSMNLNAEKETGSGVPRDFASLFSRFFKPSSSTEVQNASDNFSAAAETQNYLRRRREELRSGERAEDTNENPRV